MAHIVADRIKETTSTAGTGSLTLTGAVAGFKTVASRLTDDGDTGWFCAVNGSEWEVFLGTRSSASVLARTAVLASSNADAAVDFSAAPTVFSTVPGAKIAATGPIFSAYRSTDQTGVTNNTYVKVQLDELEFDTTECFDINSNYGWSPYRFTPNVSGYYRFEWSVDARGTNLTVGHTQLWKNGELHKNGSWAAHSSNVSISVGAAVVYMNGSTDYVELYAYSSASSGNLFSGGASVTYLSGSYIGA